jgi:hypothetical protein
MAPNTKGAMSRRRSDQGPVARDERKTTCIGRRLSNGRPSLRRLSRISPPCSLRGGSTRGVENSDSCRFITINLRRIFALASLGNVILHLVHSGNSPRRAVPRCRLELPRRAKAARDSKFPLALSRFPFTSFVRSRARVRARERVRTRHEDKYERRDSTPA